MSMQRGGSWSTGKSNWLVLPFLIFERLISARRRSLRERITSLRYHLM